MIAKLLSLALLAPVVGLVAACGGSVLQNGSGGSTCSSFTPDPPASKNVTVRFRNKTKATLYLGSTMQLGCGQPELFHVADATGTTLPWSADACTFTCAELLKASACGCAADCAIPRTIELAAGGSFDLAWDGAVFTNETLPASCASSGQGCGSACIVWRAPATPLTITGSGYSKITCQTGGACGCTPAGSGSCSIDMPATVGGLEVKASAKLASVTDGAIVELDLE